MLLMHHAFRSLAQFLMLEEKQRNPLSMATNYYQDGGGSFPGSLNLQRWRPCQISGPGAAPKSKSGRELNGYSKIRFPIEDWNLQFQYQRYQPKRLIFYRFHPKYGICISPRKKERSSKGVGTRFKEK